MADSALKIRITDAMKDAMRAKDKVRLGTIRLILAELKRIEVDERIELSDERIISILDKMLKQRRDSSQQYQAAGRPELAATEDAEIVIIQEFMPRALSEEEVLASIQAAIRESGAASMKDMGMVMNLLKPRLSGRTDMGQVSKLVKQALS